MGPFAGPFRQLQRGPGVDPGQLGGELAAPGRRAWSAAPPRPSACRPGAGPGAGPRSRAWSRPGRAGGSRPGPATGAGPRARLGPGMEQGLVEQIELVGPVRLRQGVAAPAVEQRAQAPALERLGHRGRLIEARGGQVDRAIPSGIPRRTPNRSPGGSRPDPWPGRSRPGAARGSGGTPRGGPGRSGAVRSVPIIRRARAFSSSRGRTGGRVAAAARRPARRRVGPSARRGHLPADAMPLEGQAVGLDEQERRLVVDARQPEPAVRAGGGAGEPVRRPTGRRRRRRSAGPPRRPPGRPPCGSSPMAGGSPRPGTRASDRPAGSIRCPPGCSRRPRRRRGIPGRGGAVAACGTGRRRWCDCGAALVVEGSRDLLDRDAVQASLGAETRTVAPTTGRPAGILDAADERDGVLRFDRQIDRPFAGQDQHGAAVVASPRAAER